jgi:hypothetical protein
MDSLVVTYLTTSLLVLYRYSYTKLDYSSTIRLYITSSIITFF